jgi:hypothetical protein
MVILVITLQIIIYEPNMQTFIKKLLMNIQWE